MNDMVEMQNPLDEENLINDVVDSRSGVILDVHQKKLRNGAFGPLLVSSKEGCLSNATWESNVCSMLVDHRSDY